MNWKGLFKFMGAVVGFVVLFFVGALVLELKESTMRLKTPIEVQCSALPSLREGQRVIVVAPLTTTGAAIECGVSMIPIRWAGQPAPNDVYRYVATWRGGELVDAQPATTR